MRFRLEWLINLNSDIIIFKTDAGLKKPGIFYFCI